MRDFEALRELQGLRVIVNGGAVEMHTNQLERDFLAFSAIHPSHTLSVREPMLYTIEGDEREHLAKLLQSAGRTVPVPVQIGIGGEFMYGTHDDLLIFMSPQQLHAEYFSNGRVHLNPLIENVYTNGAALLRDFAVHEGLYGTTQYSRGELNLRELALFPEAFTPGRYELKVTLDTPDKSVSCFKEFTDLLLCFKNEPKKNLLDPRKIAAVRDSGVRLRERLGSLSRYELPNNTFSVLTDSCILHDADAETYHFFVPEENTNVAVFFGNPPLQNMQSLKGMHLLPGGDAQHTLAALVRMGLYVPSPAVLEQRIACLEKVYASGVRQQKKSLNETHPDFRLLMDSLKSAQESLKSIKNEERRREHVLRLSPAVLEFMVCP
ncbi:hypothetical protein HYZ97_04675, partial [Candidatus Pacearchaeota archaeon]|nr:hypothetical protein [Candidatus Pacearchaeota archaeon]